MPEQISLSDLRSLFAGRLGSHLQLASTLILCSLGHHRPGSSYILVGERNSGSTVSVAIDSVLQPTILRALGFLEPISVSTRAQNQYRSQSAVADLLAQADDIRLAAAAVLPWRQAKVGRELATATKRIARTQGGV